MTTRSLGELRKLQKRMLSHGKGDLNLNCWLEQHSDCPDEQRVLCTVEFLSKLERLAR